MKPPRLLKKHEYWCSGCNKIFDKGWSDAEAAEEFYDRHPGEPLDDTTAMVCDVCYESILKDIKENPWKYEGLK
jgi:hypothetical protein